MNKSATAPAALAGPSSVDDNIFAPAHKAIRRGLSDLLCHLGSADWETPASRAQLAQEIESMLAFCELHLQLEEEVVRPACGDSLVPEAFDTGHPTHRQLIAETRALVRAVEVSRLPHRSSLAHALYLHVSVLIADCLQHMAEEERVLWPLMLQVLGPEKTWAIHRQIVAAVPASARVESARRMLVAGNLIEQRALTAALLAQASRGAVLALLASVRSQLDAATFDDLVHLAEAPAEVAS